MNARLLAFALVACCVPACASTGTRPPEQHDLASDATAPRLECPPTSENLVWMRQRIRQLTTAGDRNALDQLWEWKFRTQENIRRRLDESELQTELLSKRQRWYERYELRQGELLDARPSVLDFVLRKFAEAFDLKPSSLTSEWRDWPTKLGFPTFADWALTMKWRGAVPPSQVSKLRAFNHLLAFEPDYAEYQQEVLDPALAEVATEHTLDPSMARLLAGVSADLSSALPDQQMRCGVVVMALEPCNSGRPCHSF